MSSFSKALNDTFITFEVDLSAYRRVRQKVRKLYPNASDEMVKIVVNFVHHKILAVSLHKSYWANTGVSYSNLSKAVSELLQGGYIDIKTNRWFEHNGKGRSRVYERTPHFEEVFKFRNIPKRIWVNKLALTKNTSIKSEEESREVSKYNQNIALSGSDIASISALRTYFSMVSKVKLSLSNGGQVFEDTNLRRLNGARLYQMGMHGYQTIPKEERAFLLIDGQPTVELDYVSLHPSLLLNMQGAKCPKRDLYSSILRRLRIPKTKARRAAIKEIVLIAINMPTIQGFYSYLGRKHKGYRNELRTCARPKDIYEAIVGRYPKLKPYIGTGKDHGRTLQEKDSEIMMNILETLAKQGIVALPLHDSVICQAQYKDVLELTMKDVYKKHTGFDIAVK